MQHVSPLPALPQFASLSLLTVDGMAEPMISVAPTAICSCTAAINAIREMHCYIKSVLLSSAASNNPESDKMDDFTLELLREDIPFLSQQQQSTQVYRPSSTNGMAIHYRYLDCSSGTINSSDAAVMTKLQSIILTSSVSSKTNPVVDPSSKILGIIVCVAMTGPSMIFTASSLSYTLNQRIHDCIQFIQQQLQKPSTNTNSGSIKELLTSYLLIDDEHRISSTMLLPSPTASAPATDYIPLPYVADEKSRTAMFSPLSRMATPIVGLNKAARRASTGIVRNVMMNVASNNTNQNTTSPDAGIPPIELGFPLHLRPNSADAARSMTDRLTILSVSEQSTFLHKYEHSGQERKANFDLTGGTASSKNRFRRVRRNDTTRDADFDHFDYKGPTIPAVTTTATMTSVASTLTSTDMSKLTNKSVTPTLNRANPEPTSQGKLLFKSSAKDTKRGPSSRRPTASLLSTTNSTSNGDMQSQQSPQPGTTTRLSDRITNRKKSSLIKMETDDATNDSRSNSGHPDTMSVFSNDYEQQQQPQQKPPTTKLQVNIALNEDLSCSYKLSQLSSCSVDGIVQVQLKSSIPNKTNIPFILVLNDPMAHIESLNENSKFASKVNKSSNDSFNVVIPEQEKYYSLLKYRCKSDLRPVPIRVQAKVKSDGDYCRVALQISSNPNNESRLTDLTIAMGVPTNVVDGESVETQPRGGVWDPSKSSVLWHVSELGSGEKFQLQARFVITDSNHNGTSDFNFPVMVRCQCLHVQLSGISFDVKQQPSLYPTEMTMKVASRFRLSHREKNI